MGIRILYSSGNPDDPANKDYRIWYNLIAPDKEPPAGPEDLRESFFTRRKKDLMEFAFGDSGKTAYLCIQIESDGKNGPMVSALIS
ncbi:peptidase S45, penicillin amidase [Treponema primitia ZAS-2]|uniref:Peptidase S45, penicillin amidase n=1 Tax=Treponema primitia (strain ATCC BAA-887 / DSM 12427 / ZAS-2) TaxID=545694 RepID=F5YP04_TREPZ|nr:hypothetical protein [Treponema primitia]AEF85380.1 peptidase S45, penicillin amidase [Treponema primitia ZAS-2]